MPRPIGAQNGVSGALMLNGRFRTGCTVRDGHSDSPVSGAANEMPPSRPLAGGPMQAAAALTGGGQPPPRPPKPAHMRGRPLGAAQQTPPRPPKPAHMRGRPLAAAQQTPLRPTKPAHMRGRPLAAAGQQPPVPPLRSTSLGVVARLRGDRQPDRRHALIPRDLAASQIDYSAIGCGEQIQVLDDPSFLSLLNRFERLRPNDSDSLFQRMKKAAKRDTAAYRTLKGDLAERLGLPRRCEGVDVIRVVNRLNEIKEQPANATAALAATPALTGLTLNSGTTAEVAAALLAALSRHAVDIHGPSDLVQGELLGGKRFSDSPVLGHSIVNVRVNGVNQPVNASVVDSHTIVAQAPLAEQQNTQSLPAFYAMLMDHGVSSVVNLLNDDTLEQMHNPGPPDVGSQGGAGSPAVPRAINAAVFGLAGQEPAGPNPAELKAQYWPEKGKTINYHLGERFIKVKTSKVKQHSGYQVVTLRVSEPAVNQVREVTLYHYTQWPFAGSPQGRELRQLTAFARDYRVNRPAGTTVVQCSHGYGRSGVFTVLEQLMAGIDSGIVNQNNLLESLAGLIYSGIVARGNSFIQYSSDVELVLNIALDALERRAGAQVPGAASQDGAAAGTGIAQTDTSYVTTLSTILHWLRTKQLTTVDKQHMTVSRPVWREMISGLTVSELYQLAVDGAGPLGERSGYPEALRQPVIEAYVRLRVSGLIQQEGGVQQALAWLGSHSNPVFQPDAPVGRAMRVALNQHGQQPQVLQQRTQFVRGASSSQN